VNPEKRLEAVEQLARAALVGWKQYEATEAALGASTIPSGGDGGSSEHADPVLSVVLSHQRYLDNVGRISEALGILRELQREMAWVRRQHPETARTVEKAVSAARCDGSVDAVCTRNAVRNIDGHEICWTCISRLRRSEEKADGAKAS
jgi:hypothetical protein